jgi:hypothetical protein
VKIEIPGSIFSLQTVDLQLKTTAPEFQAVFKTGRKIKPLPGYFL